jgi:hypothetical protein
MTAEGDEPDDQPSDRPTPEADADGRQRRRAVGVEPATPRPMLERIGMAAIAVVIALLFGGVALAAFGGGEPFLGVMGAIGALMTLWVAAVTLLRG